ncbi:MAG: glycosyltransferase family 4 protein [Infirmifilum sp.]
MKVLMVSPRLSGIGGVAQHVSKLVAELRGRGVEVETMSVEDTVHIPVKGLYNPSFALSALFRSFYKRLRGQGFDVAHGHNVPSWPAVQASSSQAKIITQHGIYSQQIELLHGRIFGRLGSWVEEKAIKSVDALTCVSRSTCEHYKSLGVEAYYIPNAVDLREMPQESLRLYDKQVVYVGRLSREKGFDILLEAAKRVDPSIHIVVLGSGVKELEEKARILSRRQSNFHYLGYKPREEALKVIRGSDLLVLPSRVEGMPTVLLEAMALRTPILASRIPGVLDVLDDSCAALIHPGDAGLLAKAITDYTYSYPRGLVERAYLKIITEFNWERVINEYLELYEQLLSR